MKIVAAAASAAVLACTLPALCQETRMGVSTPPPALAAGDLGAADATGYRPTPVAALPATGATARQETGGETSFRVVGPYTANVPLAAKEDVDAGIVMDVPHGANECPPGTLLKVRMHETLSTKTTARGTNFTAELTEPVRENERVLIPAGSTLRGRVTYVHGGKRIGGVAALHLEAHTLVLPDGREYALRAQVIDTDQSFATRIDGEGTIVRRDHIKGTLAAMSLTTGSAAVAGAVIGGGVGAAVGAGVGAGLSAAWWLKQDRQTVLPQDTAVTFSLNDSLELGGSRLAGAGR